MSHADPGPLASYNSLQDKHLVGYFSNTRMKRHLKKSGLVAKNGTIIDEKTYRLNMAKKEHRKHVRDLLATAIVHKALDMERMRQYEIRKRLDQVYKVELVKRVKEGRRRKGDEDILPLLSPRERSARLMHRSRQGQGDLERPATAPSAYGGYRGEDEDVLKPTELVYDQDSGKLLYRTNPTTAMGQNGYLRDETEELGPSPYTRAFLSTYPAPAPPPSGTPRRGRPATTPRRGVRLQRFHYLAKTEPAVAHRIQLQSMAEVTMKFLGPSLVLTNSMFPEDRLSEVMILQQHCGGSTLCVFRELLPPNTIFTFISRRHRGAPFGLTFYIDGLQDIRLSSCCEYKHKPGYVLGGKNGHFQFVVVEGAAPCYRCQVASSYSKNGKKKHRTSQGENEDERVSKTFMTEPVNDEEEVGETFDVIITKINPNDGKEEDESKDASGMVDGSTQTPREDNTSKENKEEEKAEVEEVEEILEATPDDPEAEQIKEDEKVSEGAEDEPGEDKYEEEEFEQDEEKEKENEDEQKTRGERDKEDQGVNDKGDYNEDFETEDEKEDEDAEEKEDKVDEQKDESEDEIQDETEPAQVRPAEAEKEDDDAEEVEDETDEKNEESTYRPGSATDSEGRLSKSVSFDEDVTVIEEEQLDAEKTPDDVPEEDGAEPKHDDPAEKKEEEEPTSREDIREEEPALRAPGTPFPRETADKEEQDDELILSPRYSDISSSSSDSSSSESSDSKGEEDQMEGRKYKKKTKLTAKSSQDPGSDPDLVSTGKLPDQALKGVGVQPGTKHEGSVQPLLEGKEEINLTGVSLTRSQVEEVASIVESRDYVGSVILRNTGVDDQSVEKLAEAFKDATPMKMLNLNVNQIGPAGARHIAKVIKENNEFRMLLLNGNPLTNEGVQTIVNAILGNPDTSVVNLDLGDCGVSDDGAKFIAGLITSSRTVSQLTLSSNSIGINGWRKISDALKTNTTLTTLSLDYNKIGDEEALVIAEGLRECRNLRYVDLDGNRIGDEGGRKLLEAVKVNKSIIDLTLMPANYISKEILNEMKDVLKENLKNHGKPDSGNEQRDTEENVQPAEVEEEEPKPSEGPGEDVAPQGQEHEDEDDKEEEDTVASDTADVEQAEEPEWNDGPSEDTAQGGEEQKDQVDGGELETGVDDTTDVAPEEEPDRGEGPGEGVGQEGQEQKEHEDKEEEETGVGDAPDVAQAEEPDHSDGPRKDEAQAGQEKKDQEENGEAETVVSDIADVEREQETAAYDDQQEKNDAKPDDEPGEQNEEAGEIGPEDGEQPSGSAPAEEEAGGQQNPPESVPQRGETVQGGTDAASEPINVKDGPAESGAPPGEAEQPPSESRAQPSDTEEDLSEVIEQPNETKQEGISEYKPSEEMKEEEKEDVVTNAESPKELEDAGTEHAEAEGVLSSEAEKVDEHDEMSKENQENQPADKESIKEAIESTEESR